MPLFTTEHLLSFTKWPHTQAFFAKPLLSNSKPLILKINYKQREP